MENPQYLSIKEDPFLFLANIRKIKYCLLDFFRNGIKIIEYMFYYSFAFRRTQ